MSEKQINTELNQLLQDAFQNHGVECQPKDGKLFFPQQRMLLASNFYDHTSSQTSSIQLDVNLEIGIGRSICESFSGIGNCLEDAVKNGVENFLASSFHVLLSAFFTDKFDEQTNRGVWIMDDRQYEVYMSNLVCRGTTPEPDKANLLPTLLEEIIKKQSLSEGTHWVRLFLGQYNHDQTTEILLDNETWDAVLSDVRKINFPLSKDYFSSRIFMILSSGIDISRLASIIGWMALDKKYDDEVVEVLIKEGYSSLEAQKINIFIPLAFGRAVIRMNCEIEFSDEALNADTNETIYLNDEPIFVQATLLADHIVNNGCMYSDLFGAIGWCSAEVSAFSKALNDGNSLEDLASSKFGTTRISFV